MNPGTDLVVRLVAVTNLKTCIDDWDFEVSMFTPYFAQTISLFTQLVQDCDEFENKLKVVGCLGVVVERLESGVVPFAQSIVQILPGLWDGKSRVGFMIRMWRSALVQVCDCGNTKELGRGMYIRLGGR